MKTVAVSFVLAACLSLPGWARAQSDADFDSLSAAAVAARDAGDSAKAADLYTQAVTLRPDWQEGWWFLGVLRYDADRYGPAIEALNHVVALNPNGGPALALRGLCEFETAQYPSSLQDLQRAIALGAADNPRNGRIVRLHEAMLLTRLGNFDEAIGRYLGLMKQVASHGASHGASRGAIDDEMTSAIGLAGLRMPLLTREVAPEQGALVAATGHAAVALMTGDPASAEKSFQVIFDHFPTLPNVHYFYGYLLLSTEPDAAMKQFRAELAVSPASANAHAMLAWTLGLRGRYAESLPDARQAVAENSSLAMAQMVLGRAMVETGDVEAGLPHLEKVLQAEPGNIEAHLTLAKAYSTLGRKDEARRERLTCLQLSGMGGGTDADQ